MEGVSIMENVLSYAEAKEIYGTINAHLNRTDADMVGLYQDMVARAIRYAHIRAGWAALTREQKRDQDAGRTSAHDAFIASLNIIARTEGEVGAAWKERLSDDRKRIGDFACYIALFEGIGSR